MKNIIVKALAEALPGQDDHLQKKVPAAPSPATEDNMFLGVVLAAVFRLLANRQVEPGLITAFAGFLLQMSPDTTRQAAFAAGLRFGTGSGEGSFFQRTLAYASAPSGAVDFSVLLGRLLGLQLPDFGMALSSGVSVADLESAFAEQVVSSRHVRHSFFGVSTSMVLSPVAFDLGYGFAVDSYHGLTYSPSLPAGMDEYDGGEIWMRLEGLLFTAPSTVVVRAEHRKLRGNLLRRDFQTFAFRVQGDALLCRSADGEDFRTAGTLKEGWLREMIARMSEEERGRVRVTLFGSSGEVPSSLTRLFS